MSGFLGHGPAIITSFGPHLNKPVPPPPSAPRFYVTDRQPLRPGILLLATLSVLATLSALGYAAQHTRKHHSTNKNTPGQPTDQADEDDEKDDPNQVDTIYLGDAADAPEPAARRRGRPTPVHATVVVHLPRYGKDTGLIPDVTAGHALYRFLAAFNQSSAEAMDQVLPNAAAADTTAALMDLRRQTGGYNLLSSKQVAPGVLVFRLRDQTPDAHEALGTLQLQPQAKAETRPPRIATFSLRTLP